MTTHPRLLAATLVCLFTLVLWARARVQAQSSDATHQYQTWTQLSLMGPLSGDWFLQSDVNWRMWDDFTPQAGIVRAGLLYRVMPHMYVGVGYAWQPAWRQRGLLDYFDDHRLYQQWQWEVHEHHSGIKVQLRSRFEQRLRVVEGHGELGLRLRELVRLTVPLTDDKALMLIVWDELFVSATDAGQSTLGVDGSGSPRVSAQWQFAGFDQNRAFVGLGYQAVPGTLRLELGYQNQWVRRPGHPGGDLIGHTGMLVGALSWR